MPSRLEEQGGGEEGAEAGVKDAGKRVKGRKERERQERTSFQETRPDSPVRVPSSRSFVPSLPFPSEGTLRCKTPVQECVAFSTGSESLQKRRPPSPARPHHSGNRRVPNFRSQIPEFCNFRPQRPSGTPAISLLSLTTASPGLIQTATSPARRRQGLPGNLRACEKGGSW